MDEDLFFDDAQKTAYQLFFFKDSKIVKWRNDEFHDGKMKWNLDRLRKF